MKIIVRTEEHRIFLPIPTGLITNRLAVRLWLRAMQRSQKYVSLPEQAEKALWNLPEEKILRLCDELRRIKKQYKTWPLVEVESANGDRMEIIL